MVSKYLLDLKSTHVGGGRNWDTTNESSQGIKPYDDIETIIQSLMNSNQQHRGRIQTHQCATEDTVPIIGGSTELINQEKAQIAATEGFHWKDHI